MTFIYFNKFGLGILNEVYASKNQKQSANNIVYIFYSNQYKTGKNDMSNQHMHSLNNYKSHMT